MERHGEQDTERKKDRVHKNRMHWQSVTFFSCTAPKETPINFHKVVSAQKAKLSDIN